MEAAITLDENPYVFRPYKKEDLPFIQSSWGYSYYTGAGYKPYLMPEEFHFHHRPIRENILKKPDIAIIVCVSREDEDTILGWILVEKPRKTNAMILHYIYVKQAFKSEGLANELMRRALPGHLVLMTHMTEKAARILHKKNDRFRDFLYIPHLI